MQVTEASRDRLRALGRRGATLEATLVEALDALEQRLLGRSRHAEARRRAMSADEPAVRHSRRSRCRALPSMPWDAIGRRHFPGRQRNEQRRRAPVGSGRPFPPSDPTGDRGHQHRDHRRGRVAAAPRCGGAICRRLQETLPSNGSSKQSDQCRRRHAATKRSGSIIMSGCDRPTVPADRSTSTCCQGRTTAGTVRP